MLNIIIPCYNSRDTLPNSLGSLCAQTKKNFFVTLVDDASEQNYDDILERYQRLLHIKYLRLEENGGAGAARQAGLDYVFTTPGAKFDYVMFLDSDDTLMPRAVEILTSEARKSHADIITSSIIAEQADKDVHEIPVRNANTWVHGKLYRTQWLSDLGLRFVPNLRYGEDASFNLAAVICADTIAALQEPMCYWRNNSYSLTRSNQYFSEESSADHLYGQLKACEFVNNYGRTHRLGPTIAGIYNAYQLSLIVNDKRLTGMIPLISSVLQSIIPLKDEKKFRAELVRQLQSYTEAYNKIEVFPQSFYHWFYSLTGGVSF